MKKLYLLVTLVFMPGAVGAAELYLGNSGTNFGNTLPGGDGKYYYKCQNSGAFSCQSDYIKISYTGRGSGNGTSLSPYILTGCSFISCACGHNSYLSRGKSCTKCSNNMVAIQDYGQHTNTSCEYCFRTQMMSTFAPAPGVTVKQCSACPSNATCDGTTNIVCAKGYYGTSSCSKCPSAGGTPGTTKAAGAKAVTECYIPKGGTFYDESGHGTFDGGDCYYTK